METSEALAVLDASGIDVEVVGPHEVALTVDGRRRLATIKATRSRPTPSSIARDTDRTRERDDEPRIILYVVDRISPPLARHAIDDPRIAVVGRDEAIVDGTYRRPLAGGPDEQAPTSARTHRRPWGRFAAMRVLLRSRHPRTQQQLAEESGVTQAAVSGILRHQLDGLVRRDHGGWTALDPERLWSMFLDDYVGPGGITTRWLGHAAITDQARRVQERVPNALLSGDVAADALAPWRVPRSVVLYARAGAPLASAGLAEATSERATVELVVPADRTIRTTAKAWASVEGTVADPLIVAWDVVRTGGPDALEAADRLRRATLDRWAAR